MKTSNKALHRTAIPLRSIAAGELGRYPIAVLHIEKLTEKKPLWMKTHR